MSRTVLILGGRAPAALEHARRFHARGWRVHVADSIPCRLTGWSSAVTASHALPPPRFDPRGFVVELGRIVRDQCIDLLLPTCEEVFHLARHRAALPRELHVVADDFDRLRALHSKWEFAGLARTHGMPVPDSALIHTLAEARAWAGGRGVVLKPEYSRFGVHVRLYPAGIPEDAPELASLGAWVVQAFVAGDELCSYAIAEGGRLLAHMTYRPAYRLSRSSSYYFDPVENPGIGDAVARLVRGIGYSGQISFDWIVGSDDRAVALECNPRATSGLHLFAPYVDVPAALLGDIDVNGERDAYETSHGRARMIVPVMLAAGLSGALRSGRLAQWRADWKRADDVISIAGDRAPQVGAMADLASYVRLAMQRRCSVREAATRDIEWDGETLPPVSP
ncbi:ATP-grasp domain-containing protein [Thermomonas sp.]|uniref:ATP-grasp domain-containing protein n=1 Tax=Thermomonas sp. TaxID=1971895 RepID=UPI0024883D6E|nr:ATP-grasp domain-containing protein [Thermomonas sp.]MDI1252742.1 ATP-grasp domain-containing protein [Thermomonas sp.]